jgi:hypothetical protein
MATGLLFVGWEAADWRILHPLVDAGTMPNLRRIIEHGASGQLLSIQPLVGAAQWTSLATGKRPWQHGVCHPLESVTVANQPVPATAGARRSLALWEILARAGKRAVAVGWPATHATRSGNATVVSDRFAQPTAGPGVKPWPPAAPGTYWPEETRERLDHWRMSPADVQADIISLCVPQWRQINQKRDKRLGQLRVFLAADFSHQAAMMTLLKGGDWDFAAVRFPALGLISRIFLPGSGLLPDSSSEPEFRLYQNVIPGACSLLDQMLGKLMEAAGKDAAVLVGSPHGVVSQPSAAGSVRFANDEAWKSPHGIFAACGPGWASDSLLFGATVLDVAPTVLAWFGLPIGDDMEGRALLEGFVKAPEVTRVPSWESEPAARPRTAAEQPCSADSAKTAAILRRESDWNLAQSYLDAGHSEEALHVLEGLFRSFPEKPEFGHALFQCQLALRRPTEAGQTLEVVLEGLVPGLWSLVLQAELLIASGRAREARALVDEARALQSTESDAMRRLGLLLLRLRGWDALAELAQRALRLDDNDAVAWMGLAEAHLRKKKPAEAETAAMRAIRLNYYLSDAHLLLARSLVAQGHWQQAHDSLQTLLKLQPDNRRAATYDRRIGRPPGPSVRQK